MRATQATDPPLDTHPKVVVFDEFDSACLLESEALCREFELYPIAGGPEEFWQGGHRRRRGARRLMAGWWLNN
ncbi:MAG: hypothetical protein R2857_00540 [Vampirovibrionales bacterium]